VLEERRRPDVTAGLAAAADRPDSAEWPAPAESAPPAEPGRVWHDPVVWAVAATVFAAYFVISLFRLLRLEPTSWDLGIYTEYVKQLSQLRAPVVDIRGAGFNLLGDHFQIGLAVIAPLFRLFPSAATLLFVQALCAAVAVFPVADAGRAFGGRATGRLTGFAFGFSWGLQQMVNFDFHEIALAVPLLAFSLSALVRRRPRAAVAWAAPLVLVKEDQGFTVAAIGLLLGLSAAFPPAEAGWRSRLPLAARAGLEGAGGGDDRRWGDGSRALWGGLFLMAWGLLWSLGAILVIIPHFNPLHEYYYWKDGGVVGGGQSFSVGGLLSQTAAGWTEKLQTVLLLLLPTAFLALGSPLALAALPSLALRFMSSNSAYWGTEWHYNATLMPILFIAAAETIGRLRGAAPGRPGPLGWRDQARWRDPACWRTTSGRYGAGLMAVLTVVLACSFPLRDLGRASTYRLDAHVAAADAAMALVPGGATVATSLDLLAPLAARTDTFWLGNPGNPLCAYIVFDGDDSGYRPAVSNVPAFIGGLYPADGYVQVFDRDDVYVFRRR
jgi:uncharacterized membrane protein